MLKLELVMKKIFSIQFFYPILIILGVIFYPPDAFCQKPFVVSTEFQIGKIKHMVEKAPEGVYISVGSERSFRGASMSPQVTHVYLLDLSPEILRFNKINIELLKAPSQEKYLQLRWNAIYDDWKKFSPNLSEDDFGWWKDNVRNLENMDYPLPEALNRYQSLPYAAKFLKIRNKLTCFYQRWKNKETPSLPEKLFIESISFKELETLAETLHIPTGISSKEWNWWKNYGKNKELDCPKVWLKSPEEAVDLGQIVDFKTGNYLFDDQLYERLHALAMNNQFTIMKIDLSDDAQLQKFLDHLRDKKASISILDLDNLYFEEYIGDKKYKEIVNRFLPLGKENSLLIVMNNYKDYACGQFQIYIAFTFENISHWPSFFFLQAFFDTLPNPLLDLINGRIYEEKETPPMQYLVGE